MSSPTLLNDFENGYLIDGEPAFGKTFRRAMSFHFPEGLAAVRDDSGAYHIDLQGSPCYAARYREAYGFYDGIATVCDERGWFHIRTDGNPVHERRFRWSGNFQERRCVVLDKTGFFHIDVEGADAYDQRYRYAGDFRGGVAVVHGLDGACHVTPDGERLNTSVYRHAEPFHKGYAVVEDEEGSYHVDRRGQAIHPLRFRSAEPFYNGVALCRSAVLGMVRLCENGSWTRIARTTEPVDLETIVGLLAEGARMSLFLRHAERHPITPETPNWGNEVLLTSRGIDAAARLGASLSPAVSLGLWSSPVERCRQTCEAIARGADKAERQIITHTNLGNPGIYFDGTGAHEGPMRDDFHAFARDYIDRGNAPGMRPLSPTSEELLGFLTEKMSSHRCTVFITHDFFAAVLMHYLGLKAPDRTDWCSYLEGVCLIKDESGMTFRRFRGE